MFIGEGSPTLKSPGFVYFVFSFLCFTSPCLYNIMYIIQKSVMSKEGGWSFSCFLVGAVHIQHYEQLLFPHWKKWIGFTYFSSGHWLHTDVLLWCNLNNWVKLTVHFKTWLNCFKNTQDAYIKRVSFFQCINYNDTSGQFMAYKKALTQCSSTIWSSWVYHLTVFFFF